MPLGSSSTIDRIQVEFSANIEELVAGLATVSTLLDATNSSFQQSEAASEQYAASMEQAGAAAAVSSEGFGMLAGSIEAFSAVSAAGSDVITTYADTLLDAQTAIYSAASVMDGSVDRFNEVNNAATNAATAIGRINTISNNAYTTFNRLATTSSGTAKSFSKLLTETKSLANAYSSAISSTDTFTKSVIKTGDATNTVITQINQYSTAISTAGMNARSAADDIDRLTQKTGETEDSVDGLADAFGKLFTGISVGTVLNTLDVVLNRGAEVSQMFQEFGSDITTSLGEITPELDASLNAVVEHLIGIVPATMNESLGSAVAMLHKYQRDLEASDLQSLMQEYASYADLWGMSMTDLISSTQKMFTKYHITSVDEMKTALAEINAVNNLAPDAAPTSVISILNNNRQAIGASGWSFENALSRIINAGNDRAMSKFKEYLSALQNVKAIKGSMFESDEAFTAWVEKVAEMVKNAKDETEAQKIIMDEYEIRGNQAIEIAKYLRLDGSEFDRLFEILDQIEKNGSGYQQYLKNETTDEKLARTSSVTNKKEKELGDGVNQLKEDIADQVEYDKMMYDCVSLRLGDIADYVDSIPVIGETLKPLTKIVQEYLPALNIRTGIKGTPAEFIDEYERRLANGEYVQDYDDNYYLSYRKLADELKVDYSDLKFSGDDYLSVMRDFADGLYTDLMFRVRQARAGEEVTTLVDDINAEGMVNSAVAAQEGLVINLGNYSGSIQIQDGKLLSGTIPNVTGTIHVENGTIVAEESLYPEGTQIPKDEPKSWWEYLWPFGRASAADDIIFDTDENTVEEEPIDYSGTLQQINTGIDNLNTNLSEKKGDIYVTQNFYSPTVDSYTVKNAAAQALRTNQTNAFRTRA